MDALRRATPNDALVCGRICYQAFAAINDAHGFPHDFASLDGTIELLYGLLNHPGFYGVLAERDGTIIGGNFLDERSLIAGVGPIFVDPAVQDQRVGRRLMEDVISRAASREAPGVRLCQSAFNRRSLSLYTKLGFRTREPLLVINGRPLNVTAQGYNVRIAEHSDIPSCNAVCLDVHGFDRGNELKDAVDHRRATVVERDGQITGYATAIGFFAHTVARTDQDLIALISAASEIVGPGFLLPLRNHDVFAWCLSRGLKVMAPMNLMTIGLYNEPAGAYLPCVLY